MAYHILDSWAKNTDNSPEEPLACGNFSIETLMEDIQLVRFSWNNFANHVPDANNGTKSKYGKGFGKWIFAD